MNKEIKKIKLSALRKIARDEYDHIKNLMAHLEHHKEVLKIGKVFPSGFHRITRKPETNIDVAKRMIPSLEEQITKEKERVGVE